LGWLVYRRAGTVDPLERALGPVHTLLKNKYWVDEIYAVLFIRPARWLADVLVSDWIDRRGLDGILHGIARAGLWLGRLVRQGFDVPVVNGAGDGLANGTRSMGALLRRIQTGRVQDYMLLALLLAIVAGVLVIVL